jgi:hypothetical protein
MRSNRPIASANCSAKASACAASRCGRTAGGRGCPTMCLQAVTPTTRLVLTLGRLRATRAPAFFKASAGAEASLLKAPGAIWASALARPPFVSTCSLWESTKALSTYAYGNAEPGHPNAIHADSSSGGFHHQSAFIRFRPFAVRGHLDGRNPLSETAVVDA